MHEELIKRLSRYSKQCITEKLDADFAEANEEAIEILKTARQGKWIPVSTIVCKCSFCGNYIMRADAEDNYFCYKCGADMRGN